MEGLVPVLQPGQDLDRLVDRRLAHQHGLEAPFERRVLLDVLAVLVECRRPDHVELPAGQRRLQHVPGVHRALGRAGAHDGVHLVEEDDELVGVPGDVVDDALEALLELAAVLRAGDHSCEVESDEALAAQRLRDVVVDDPLCDALDDRGLPDARVAEEDRVVLRSAREDLDRLLDLVRAPDHRVELPVARLLGEVSAVLVERLRGARGAAAALRGLHAADHGAAKLRVGDSEARQQLSGRLLLVPRQREQHVLRADVGGAELARFLVGREQHGFRVGGEGRRDVGARPLVGLLLDLLGDRAGVRAELLQHVAHDVVLNSSPEQVIGVEVEAAPLERLLRRPLEELAGRVAEGFRHVDLLDRALGSRAWPACRASAEVLEEVGEELVEQASSTATSSVSEPEPTGSRLSEVDLA